MSDEVYDIEITKFNMIKKLQGLNVVIYSFSCEAQDFFFRRENLIELYENKFEQMKQLYIQRAEKIAYNQDNEIIRLDNLYKAKLKQENENFEGNYSKLKELVKSKQREFTEEIWFMQDDIDEIKKNILDEIDRMIPNLSEIPEVKFEESQELNEIENKIQIFMLEEEERLNKIRQKHEKDKEEIIKQIREAYKEKVKCLRYFISKSKKEINRLTNNLNSLKVDLNIEVSHIEKMRERYEQEELKLKREIDSITDPVSDIKKPKDILALESKLNYYRTLNQLHSNFTQMQDMTRQQVERNSYEIDQEKETFPEYKEFFKVMWKEKEKQLTEFENAKTELENEYNEELNKSRDVINRLKEQQDHEINNFKYEIEIDLPESHELEEIRANYSNECQALQDQLDFIIDSYKDPRIRKMNLQVNVLNEHLYDVKMHINHEKFELLTIMLETAIHNQINDYKHYYVGQAERIFTRHKENVQAFEVLLPQLNRYRNRIQRDLKSNIIRITESFFELESVINLRHLDARNELINIYSMTRSKIQKSVSQSDEILINSRSANELEFVDFKDKVVTDLKQKTHEIKGINVYYDERIEVLQDKIMKLKMSCIDPEDQINYLQSQLDSLNTKYSALSSELKRKRKPKNSLTVPKLHNR